MDGKWQVKTMQKLPIKEIIAEGKRNVRNSSNKITVTRNEAFVRVNEQTKHNGITDRPSCQSSRSQTFLNQETKYTL